MPNEPLKILYISSWYPVAENPTHGIFVQRHARAAALLNKTVALYGYGRDNGNEKWEITHDQGVDEYILCYNKSEKSARGKWKALEKYYNEGFEKILKEWGRPDIIHLNVVFPAGIFALNLSEKHKIPLVITEHWTGYLPEDGSYRGLLKKFYTRKIIRNASAIMPVSLHLANAMKAHRLNGNYTVIPNVVNTEFFTSSSQKRPDGIDFLHLSSFDERQKNPRSIIQAFKKHSAQFPNDHLIMAGDGDNIADLREYAHSLGLKDSQIEFHFRPAPALLLSLFHRAEALLLNSRFENLPVVMIEALSCGMPVLSSNVGGIHEYINESNGLLFPFDEEGNNLSQAMSAFRSCIQIYRHDQIRSFAIQHFSKTVIAEAFTKVYQQVKQNSGS